MENYNGLLSGMWNFLRNKWLFSSMNTYVIGQKGAIWLDTSKPKEMYLTIPQLRTVIDRKATMFSNMRIELIDEKTNEKVEDQKLFKLLNAPNILDATQNEFLRNYKTQLELYGNQFMYKNQVTDFSYPVSLWNPSPYYVRPYLTGKLFDQITLDGIIQEYKYYQQGLERTFLAKDILYSKISDVDNPIVGCSPILTLKYPLTNTKYAYEYFNVISGKKGAIGILKNETTKDSMGSVPMQADEKMSITKQQEAMYGVGEDQAHVIITKANMTWQPMSYPTKDLLLQEQIDANFMAIIDLYGLNVNMFGVGKATYENVKNGIIQAYENTIIPEAETFCQRLTDFLQVAKFNPGCKLVPSFEHVNILNEDKLKGAQALDALQAALSNAVATGILDKATAINILATELGVTIKGGNVS